MRLFSVEGNRQKLDGGAMFGHCPKSVWKRWVAVDEHNRIPLACRSLLVRERGGRNVLIEAGIGSPFPPAQRERYGIDSAENRLVAALAELDVSASDVDVVVLSHLHFDHAGGLLAAWRERRKAELVFPRAQFVVGAVAWERALRPHSRDRASFLPELVRLLDDSGRLHIAGRDRDRLPLLGEGYRFSYSDGHSPGMMLTTIRAPRGQLTFVADAVPGTRWVHLPITMAYDRYPELLVNEKKALLDGIIDAAGWVLFTHDPECAAARIERDEHGRYAASERQATLRW